MERTKERCTEQALPSQHLTRLLPGFTEAVSHRTGRAVPVPEAVGPEENKLRPSDLAAHDWYRFVLSFPAHLVRHYLSQFGFGDRPVVLDPFCGTGTTLVECKKMGLSSVGIEPNPMLCFATRVKLDWTVAPDELWKHARSIAALASENLARQGLQDEEIFADAPTKVPLPLRSLPPEVSKLLLRDSISPLPLHKTLVLLDTLRENRDDRFSGHERLALAKAIVSKISNLKFGPEVGVGPAKKDAAVIGAWLACVRSIVEDLGVLRAGQGAEAIVHQGDARQILNLVKPNSIDAVITSPPYPNEKDYTRTTRLESVLLGLIQSKTDLRGLKQDLIRSNTRCVFITDNDDQLVSEHDEIQNIADAIEQRRIELGKTSGFERLYSRVTKLYFGGMLRHLSELRTALRPGAKLAYVVGDQASYLRIMIRTGRIIADIAESLGYVVEGIDLFRTRLATATKEQLREEVVLLRWPEKRIPKPTFNMSPNEPASGKRTMYASIIEKLFLSKYEPGMRQVDFERADIERFANELGIELPKNPGDLVYSFRYRKEFPDAVKATAPTGEAWIIRGAGRAKYKFVLVPNRPFSPNPNMTATKVPDATPGIVAKYAWNDEQALLAKIRYNRLIDIFTGVTCYSLQSHLRTTVPDMGQVETDEIYVGVDKRGAHYVFPIQAKGGADRVSIVQIEQDFAICAQKLPSLICRPIAAQFMQGDVIALFGFEQSDDGIGISSEKHYKLVPPEEVTELDLSTYGTRTNE